MGVVIEKEDDGTADPVAWLASRYLHHRSSHTLLSFGKLNCHRGTNLKRIRSCVIIGDNAYYCQCYIGVYFGFGPGLIPRARYTITACSVVNQFLPSFLPQISPLVTNRRKWLGDNPLISVARLREINSSSCGWSSRASDFSGIA
jgi:hypothetical protein